MFQTRTKWSFLAQASKNYKEYNLVAELLNTNLLNLKEEFTILEDVEKDWYHFHACIVKM